MHFAFYPQFFPAQHRVICPHASEHLGNRITLANINAVGTAGLTGTVRNFEAPC